MTEPETPGRPDPDLPDRTLLPLPRNTPGYEFFPALQIAAIVLRYSMASAESSLHINPVNPSILLVNPL